MPEPVISPPETAPAAPREHSRLQLEALLEVGEAIAQQRDLPALFHDLSERLHSVIEFDFLTLILHDPARNVMRLHILETRVPTEKSTGSESPVDAFGPGVADARAVRGGGHRRGDALPGIHGAIAGARCAVRSDGTVDHGATARGSDGIRASDAAVHYRQ